METKRVLDNLRMPKQQEIFTTVANVSSLRETRCFSKHFQHFSALSKWRRWKTFQRNCVQVRSRRKEEAKTKSSIWDLKANPWTVISTMQVLCVSVLILFGAFYTKQIDSMLLWVCSVIDHRRCQNVVKTSLTHSSAARVPLLCFYYHILT